MEYDAKYVKCPYYIGNTNTYMMKLNQIRCEGIVKDSVVSLSFETKAQEQAYREMYCHSIQGYHNCLICKTLNRKWGIDDGK